MFSLFDLRIWKTHVNKNPRVLGFFSNISFYIVESLYFGCYFSFRYI